MHKSLFGETRCVLFFRHGTKLFACARPRSPAPNRRRRDKDKDLPLPLVSPFCGFRALAAIFREKKKKQQKRFFPSLSILMCVRSARVLIRHPCPPPSLLPQHVFLHIKTPFPLSFLVHRLFLSFLVFVSYLSLGAGSDHTASSLPSQPCEQVKSASLRLSLSTLSLSPSLNPASFARLLSFIYASLRAETHGHTMKWYFYIGMVRKPVPPKYALYMEAGGGGGGGGTPLIRT